MTDYAKAEIKKEIRNVLEKLKPGDSIKRQRLWHIVYRRILDKDALFYGDVHTIFEQAKKEDRTLRLLVTELKHQEVAVGSSPNRGYFRICSQEDLNESVKSKQKKIYGLYDSIKIEKENAEKHLGIQLYIPDLTI